MIKNNGAKALLVAVAILMFLGNVDFVAITLAIPSIAKHYSNNVYTSQWINTAYIVTAASFALLGGALSDIVPVKKQFYLGLSLFILAVTFAACSYSFLMLVLCRLIQGVGYGLSFPLIYIFIQRALPEEEHGFASAIIVSSTAVAQAISPVIASTFLYFSSWRFLFLLNVPLCLLVLYLIKGIRLRYDQNSSFSEFFRSAIVAIVLFFAMIISFLSMEWFLIINLCILLVLYVILRLSQSSNNKISGLLHFFKKNSVYFINLLIRFITQMLFIIILTYPSIYLYKEKFNYLIIGFVYLIFTISFAVSNFFIRNKLDANTGYQILFLGSITQILAFLLLSAGALFFWPLLAICLGFLVEGIAIGLLFSSTLFFNLKTSFELKGVFSALFLAIALAGCLFGLSYSNQIIRILDILKYNEPHLLNALGLLDFFQREWFLNYFFVMVGGLFLALICWCSVKALKKAKG